MRPLLESVQRDLFDVGADVAAGRGTGGRVTAASVRRLEAEAARRAGRRAPLRGFVVPGGPAGAGWLHLARAVCRRAELALWAAASRERVTPGRVSPEACRYLNRLSGLLFVLARDAGGRPTLWSPRRS
jgi:cob(I)alamin adenosyltransferase